MRIYATVDLAGPLLTICDADGREQAVLRRDGSMAFAPGFTVEAAAWRFWTCLSEAVREEPQ